MRAREQLEESIKEEIVFYIKKTQEWRAKRDSVHTYKFAEKIDTILVSCEKPKTINIFTTSLTIIFENNNDSRHFVEKLMDKFGIDQVNKTFTSTSWLSQAEWYYEVHIKSEGIEYTEYDVRVYPCDPTPNCNPVKVKYEIKREKWICEATGKEL